MDNINLENKILQLKESSGSHSPSIFSIKKNIPEIKIKIDACFLSNPYATDLFLDYFNKEVYTDFKKTRDLLEFYPSQNNIISNSIAPNVGVFSDEIFIGNGATEVIQAIFHNFVKDKIIINLPTFSPYYEFVKDGTEVIYYKLLKDNNFKLDIYDYVNFVKKHKPNSIVLINPNNPDGGYIETKDLRIILSELEFVENIIIDESFAHFAYENKNKELISASDLFKEFKNVMVVKSMSKDFGIAGIRCGYGILNKEKRNKLLLNGYLWNSSGLSEYFFNKYSDQKFLKEYEIVRIKYINECIDFFEKLNSIPNIKIYPSKANFGLIEILNGMNSTEFFIKMLVNHGIYVRECSDKIGLEGQFIRVASRTRTENKKILESFNDFFTKNEI